MLTVAPTSPPASRRFVFSPARHPASPRPISLPFPTKGCDLLISLLALLALALVVALFAASDFPRARRTVPGDRTVVRPDDAVRPDATAPCEV